MPKPTNVGMLDSKAPSLRLPHACRHLFYFHHVSHKFITHGIDSRQSRSTRSHGEHVVFHVNRLTGIPTTFQLRFASGDLQMGMQVGESVRGWGNVPQSLHCWHNPFFSVILHLYFHAPGPPAAILIGRSHQIAT